MVADGSAGRGKTEGGPPECASGPRDVCPGHANGSANGKGAGARHNRGDAGAADHLCPDYRRDSCRGRCSVDRFFHRRERSATCRPSCEHFCGRHAGEFENGKSFVHGTCAFVAGRFGDASGFDRAAARGAGDECRRKCSRRFPASRGAIAGRNRGRATRAEEAKVVACNGGGKHTPPRRGGPAPREEKGGGKGGGQKKGGGRGGGGGERGESRGGGGRF